MEIYYMLNESNLPTISEFISKPLLNILLSTLSIMVVFLIMFTIIGLNSKFSDPSESPQTSLIKAVILIIFITFVFMGLITISSHISGQEPSAQLSKIEKMMDEDGKIEKAKITRLDVDGYIYGKNNQGENFKVFIGGTQSGHLDLTVGENDQNVVYKKIVLKNDKEKLNVVKNIKKDE